MEENKPGKTSKEVNRSRRKKIILISLVAAGAFILWISGDPLGRIAAGAFAVFLAIEVIDMIVVTFSRK